MNLMQHLKGSLSHLKIYRTEHKNTTKRGERVYLTVGTSRTMTQVSEQFKGLPAYQFQMLKSLNPLPLEADDRGKAE